MRRRRHPHHPQSAKPLAEARGEVAYGASFIKWFAEEGKRVYGDVIPSPAGDKRLGVIKQAVGVTADMLFAQEEIFGMVGINEGMISNEVAPFGGVK